jgi:hypothetical protein
MSKEYIERGALLRKLRYISKTYGLSDVIIRRLKKAIDDSLAADVVEVVHGEWITKGNHFPYCSECETLALQKEDRGGWRHYHQSKFCPHCGANMDGKRKKV